MNNWKQLGSSAGIILLALLLALVAYEAYNAYMLEHSYYINMMASGKNRAMVSLFGGLSLLPLFGIFWSSKPSLQRTSIGLLVSILASGYVHTSIKGGLGGGLGGITFLINMIILLALIVIVFGGLYKIGSWMYTKRLKQPLTSWSGILLSLGGGLGAFLLANYVLITTQLFYWPLMRIQLIGFVWLIVQPSNIWRETTIIIEQQIASLRTRNTYWKVTIGILLGLSIVYMFFGFNLSFIPYSTAWDANHAYMYYPKVRALNNGVFYTGGPSPTPYLWMSYIAYFFNLWKPFGTSGIMSMDNIAVSLNNVSGWLSLIFGLGALHEISAYFKEKKILSELSSRTVFGIGRGYFLLWLMSGMGAFLVFVDNKTDLGVMAMTMLALMSGFIFIRSLRTREQAFSRKLSNNIPALLSGFFFAIAVASKPTAFQDVAIFLLLLVGLGFGILGLVGLFFLILAVLGKAQTQAISFYISKEFASWLGILGGVFAVGEVLRAWIYKTWKALLPILYRGLSLLSFLLLIKGSYILTKQIISEDVSLSKFVKGILLSHKNTPPSQAVYLLADTQEDHPTLDTQDIEPTILEQKSEEDPEGLYDGLQDIVGGGLTEDLQRYIGYGQRVFSHPYTWSDQEYRSYGSVTIGYNLLNMLFPKEGCYSFNTLAKTLCQEAELVQDKSGVEQLQQSFSGRSASQIEFLDTLVDSYDTLEDEVDPVRQRSIQQDINQLFTSYVAGNVIHVTSDEDGYHSIAVPYAFLTPLNVVFNRSLQNHSSYYTDIGFVWILAYILLIAGLIYSIYHRKEELLILHLATIAGWFVWWFLASGIIRYAVGIIAWTTFANAVFLGNILHTPNSSQLYRWSARTIVGILVLVALIQSLFNLTRMASQGGSGPFVHYKGHSALTNEFVFGPQGFGQQQILKNSYGADEVFHEQFGHYQAFLDHTQDRANEEGILIAGTYLQYFLDNQHNIVSDGMLTTLWQWGSDNNTAKLNERLKDKRIRYIVIDPNIGSVVMGEGNQSLFDRFVAKIDYNSGVIIDHGALSMMTQMIHDGYLRLVSSNNLGAKYAFSLSDEDLARYVQNSGLEKLIQLLERDPILLRSKLAVPKFFTSDAQDLFELIGDIFQQRLQNTQGMEDMADILGRQINTERVAKALQIVQHPPANVNLAALNTQLSSDERLVLGYYLTLENHLQNNRIQELQRMVSQLLQQSLGGGSQIISFERT